MDRDYLIYQVRMEQWQLLLADWRDSVDSAQFWGLIALIVIAYIAWYRLTDKRRLTDLLFYGALIAVVRGLIDLAGVTSGAWIYNDHILPLSPSVFTVDWTIMPLTYMLVQQHSTNWGQFFLWNAIGTGFIAGVVMPILVNTGILQFMSWSYLNEFVIMYTTATFCRMVFHLVIQVQNKARESQPNPLQSTLMQPAFKPIDEKENVSDDHQAPK